MSAAGGTVVVVRIFGWSLVVTGLAMLVALLYGGPSALLAVVVLGVLEVSLSFDNAVINATVLQRMDPFWQRMFLTIGVLIAVFGMRLLFPLGVVSIGAHLNPLQALHLALHPPANGAAYFPDGRPSYRTALEKANPKIAAYGGTFLLMLFLNFVFTKRDVMWLTWLERPLSALRRFRRADTVVTLAILALVGGYVAGDKDAEVVMASGMLGMITFIVIDGLNNRLDDPTAGRVMSASRAGLVLFLYLEVLDATFSFDGVIGAFAISSDPIIIALGLGFIGAMFVRSITVYLVQKGTLSEYIYLEHGAYWAIGALAVILLISTGHHLNEIVTSLIGFTIILAAFLTSVAAKRQR